jgi:hypothetical protein
MLTLPMAAITAVAPGLYFTTGVIIMGRSIKTTVFLRFMTDSDDAQSNPINASADPSGISHSIKRPTSTTERATSDHT